MVRMLAEHNPRIGVFFEAECIYSLNERSQMALSFQATMAEEESRNKSRSMETSLRMRLDHGLPLTPKLLGFTHDEYGKLVPDPETAHIPKLIFYLYLYGFSTQQIADTLTALGEKTYLGNLKWTSSGITQTLRNERYCGDVFTRKTFTPDVISHRSVKNRGERPRSRYLDEHEAIISRDDFIAVQHMLQNAKYKNKSILPELQVVKEGLLKGYVSINVLLRSVVVLLKSIAAHIHRRVTVDREESPKAASVVIMPMGQYSEIGGVQINPQRFRISRKQISLSHIEQEPMTFHFHKQAEPMLRGKPARGSVFKQSGDSHTQFP